VLPLVFGDEGRVLAVALDERARERAERQDDEAAPAYVVERFGDQMLAETAVLVLLLDLGVGERDQPGTGQVLAVAGELAVDMDLVRVSLWIVSRSGSSLTTTLIASAGATNRRAAGCR
jgi:hypothetical protein